MTTPRDDENCCPDGYAFDADAGACACDGTSCCPLGFEWTESTDGGTSKCTCADDDPSAHACSQRRFASAITAACASASAATGAGATGASGVAAGVSATADAVR